MPSCTIVVTACDGPFSKWRFYSIFKKTPKQPTRRWNMRCTLEKRERALADECCTSITVDNERNCENYYIISSGVYRIFELFYLFFIIVFFTPELGCHEQQQMSGDVHSSRLLQWSLRNVRPKLHWRNLITL